MVGNSGRGAPKAARSFASHHQLTGPDSVSRNSNLPKIILAFAAIYIIWGTTYLAIRVAVSTMPPFLMAGARFIVAGTVMFLVLRLRGQPMPRRLHWRSAFIVGGFLLVGGNGFVTWAEQEVPSGIAALIVATVPLWMTVFDWSLFKGPRPTRRITFGVFLGLFGIALLVGPSLFDEAGGVGLASWTIMILAPLLWSIGSLLSRSADMPPNILMSTAIEMLAGGALLLLLGLVTGESSQLDINLFTAQSWAAFLYLIVFGSIVAFTAYIYLLQHVQATRVGTYSYVNPIIAVFLGWLILGEPLSARMLVAAAVIVVAVMLIIRQRGQIAQAEEAPGPAGAPALGSQPVAAGPEND
jgi:drug/metabolite transporter (DMT)-like permease